MKQPKVGIIILNYMTYNETINCISMLSNLKYNNFFVVIVDNNSPNESSKILSNQYSNEHKMDFETFFLLSKENGGYSYGNNIGIKKAEEIGAEYILVMNNDVEILDDNFLNQAIKIMEKDNDLAMIGPGIIQNNILQLPVHDKRPTVFSYVLNNFFLPVIIFKNRIKRKNHQKANKCEKVYSVSGCCQLIRLKHLREVGYLDEGVFLYAEELILGEKFLQSNLNVYYVPEIKVIHKHSYTISRVYSNRNKEKIMARSNLYYFLKYRKEANIFIKSSINVSNLVKIYLHVSIITIIKNFKFKSIK